MSVIKRSSGGSPWNLVLQDLAALFESTAPDEGRVGRYGFTLGQYGGQYFATLNDRTEEKSASGWGRSPRQAAEDLLDQLGSPKCKWRNWGKGKAGGGQGEPSGAELEERAERAF